MDFRPTRVFPLQRGSTVLLRSSARGLVFLPVLGSGAVWYCIALMLRFSIGYAVPVPPAE